MPSPIEKFEEPSPLQKFGEKRCDELGLIADQLLRDSWIGQQTLESLSLPEAEYVLVLMDLRLSCARSSFRTFKGLVADLKSARIIPLHVT